MSEAIPWQPQQTLARGRFVLVNRLGRGGMGEVWLASDERLREPVALKFLPPEIRGDPGALDDLRRETARCHKLSHPNIVRIHDLHEDADGTAFIVMEYVDGPTLAALRLKQRSRVLSWDYLRPLVGQLCAALEYAHGEKVIHRDLKPANLMVDSRGRLKLADFGIAAVVSDSMSRVSVHHLTSGTLPYMSPQQVRGQRPQAADDIYALGATLYELLTGSVPFYSGDITHQVLHEAPELVDERLAVLEIENSVPLEVSAMVMACLAKEPGQRPQSAGAVAGRVGVLASRASPYEALEKSVFSNTKATSVAAPPSKPNPLAAPVSRGADRFSRVEKALSKPGFGHKVSYRGEDGPGLALDRTLAVAGIAVLLIGGIFWLCKGTSSIRYWASKAGIAGGFWPRVEKYHVVPSHAPKPPKAPAQTQSSNQLQPPPAVPPPTAGVTPPVAAPGVSAASEAPTAGHLWTNSLGMRFVPVPGPKVLFSIWDTRVQDFAAFVQATGYDATAGVSSLRSDGWKERGDTWQHPGFIQGPTHPVCAVNWNDAQAFCVWLTTKEQAAGKLPRSQKYRLPTEAEWTAAVTHGSYLWGDGWPPPKGAGNYGGTEAKDANWQPNRPVLFGYSDGFARTSPVGSFAPNPYGLYDVGGNVWQWCEDWFDNSQSRRATRGGSWYDIYTNVLKWPTRWPLAPTERHTTFGFRCVLEY